MKTMGKQTIEEQFTERHHVEREPFEITERIPRLKHQQIHDNVPNKTELSVLMRQYNAPTKLFVMTNNWTKSHKIDFNVEIDIGLNNIKKLRREKLKEIKTIIYELLPLTEGIKGFGIKSLAGILAYANPNRFPTLSKYLAYCGYIDNVYYRDPKKGYTKGNLRRHYLPKAHSIFWVIATRTIIFRDERYYSLYLKMKQDLCGKHPNYRKIAIHKMAVNRVATFICKDIFKLFKRLGESSLEDKNLA